MSGPRSSSVEFNLTSFDSPRVLGAVRQRLSAAIEERVKQVADGFAKDWGDYQRRIGRLEGARDALTILDEIERDNAN